MTREEAKREIDSLDYYLQNHTDDYGEKSHTAMMMAIKALEQEPFVNNSCVYKGLCEHYKNKVLDKIRAEIEEKQYAFILDRDYEEGVRFGLMLAYQIINKYKAEREEE